MGNDGMENEEKKQSKHIYEIRFSLTCHFSQNYFVISPGLYHLIRHDTRRLVNEVLT